MTPCAFLKKPSVTVGRRKVIVHVFPPVLLKTAKVRSDRAKDHDDVRRMYDRGLIDPDEIVKTLRLYREPGPVKRLKDILAGRNLRRMTGHSRTMNA